MAWVYLLKCADGSFYVGSTRDLEQRLEEHSTSKNGFTSRRRPVTAALRDALARSAHEPSSGTV